MGRKKKKVEKPWCWYCNREFEDDKILIQHQKAKHFKCHICHKKLFSGPGLAIHCMQVHKETVTKVPSAIPGRDSTEYEIYGMEGVPEGATRGRAMDDDEPSAKHPRMDNIAMPPMPPPPGMAHFPPFPPMPGMPPMPPFGMPPFPGGPMPPFPPGPGGMPPMPPTHGMYPPGPYPPRGVPPPRMGYGAGPPTGPMPPVAPPREAYVPPSSIELPPDDGDHGAEDRRWGYNGRGDEGERESSYDRDYDRRERERYDSPRDGGDVLPSSAKAGPPPAVKLGAKTRIMHPDDHSISLEERRAMMVMSGAAPSYR